MKKILLVVLVLIALVNSRKLFHGFSLNDLSGMPMDAIKKGFSGNWNGAAQDYAMSKAGLSQSQTVGSLFGQEQPKTPLSGLSSFFSGSNNNAAAPASGQNAGGINDFFSKFGFGNQGTNQAMNTGANGNGPATTGGSQSQPQNGGINGLISKFAGGSNQSNFLSKLWSH